MIKKMLYWIWQAPQNLIGWIWQTFNLPLFGAGGVCLGEYIIMSNPCSMTGVHHELGHQKQSRMLGPLYLLVIGLPSAIGNLLFRIPAVRKRFDYYKQPWEKWADKLGGVIRQPKR